MAPSSAGRPSTPTPPLGLWAGRWSTKCLGQPHSSPVPTFPGFWEETGRSFVPPLGEEEIAPGQASGKTALRQGELWGDRGLGQSLIGASAIPVPAAGLNHTETRCREMVGSTLRGTTWQEQGCRESPALLLPLPPHLTPPGLRPRAQLMSLHPRMRGEPGSVQLDQKGPGAGGSRGPEGSGIETNPPWVKQQILASLSSPNPPVSSMAFPIGPPGPPACPSTYQASVDH